MKTKNVTFHLIFYTKDTVSAIGEFPVLCLHLNEFIFHKKLYVWPASEVKRDLAALAKKML